MTLRICMLAAAFAAILPVSAQAQLEASKEVKVRVKGMNVDVQYTPQFSVPNVKDKRFRPKNWLELDVAFDADKAKVAGENNPMIDSLEFKFYVVLNVRNKEGKLTMLTANATFINIMEREESHVLMYVSPATLTNLLQKNTFTPADVSAFGVEVYKNGAAAGRHISTGATPFWDKADNFVVVDGSLLPKAKTPFAPLWGDYDVEMKAQ
ncbi:hypothetical protein DES53_103340 [Roseimicrobium gellanilyticum]|uniref:Uncharacterized protein n=1 Tax=Roseimicrobium gellanilyticum TaxID=748857 RepID=A0A366HS19_9BACT|nr:Amuc_1102 family pilus-like protein [Roseimicrobium gellanilyticum]RBP45342.1 hypothetical protein DES53_103340 [Roseimicrobium gellanilyticum]